MDLDERKKKILISVIEAYVETNEPVGSKTVVKMLDNSVSSATIRNEMAELTNLGYLDQPHTSAGRVPTASAFRLYIDKWMPKQPISKKEKKDIDDSLIQPYSDPELFISDASKILADTTGFAAVTTTPLTQSDEIAQIQILRVSPRSIAMILMTDSGFLRTRIHRFDSDISSDALEVLSNSLIYNFVGSPLSKVTLPRIQSVVASLNEYALQCASALVSFERLINEFFETEILLSGHFNLLGFPDYDTKHAKKLLKLLSQSDFVNGMLATFPHGISVVIGNEIEKPELTGSSIIATKYLLNNHGKGSIGIVGPLRMDYPATISKIEYIADIIEKSLNKLFDEDYET